MGREPSSPGGGAEVIRSSTSGPLRSWSGEAALHDSTLAVERRRGEHELAFFSILSTFTTAVDITAAEVSIEAFYPANPRTAMCLLADITAAGVAAPPAP